VTKTDIQTFFSPEAILESENIALKYFEKRLALDDDRFNVVIGFHIIVCFCHKGFSKSKCDLD
jgi:hypothetical protein